MHMYSYMCLEPVAEPQPVYYYVSSSFYVCLFRDAMTYSVGNSVRGLHSMTEEGFSVSPHPSFFSYVYHHHHAFSLIQHVFIMSLLSLSLIINNNKCLLLKSLVYLALSEEREKGG